MTQDRYRYGGARALVTLHERYLREFLEIWREADRRGLELPETDDPAYESRPALLFHVLGAAAGYLFWICEQLELPAPALEPRPDTEGFAERAEGYMERVLSAWQTPLRSLSEARAYKPAYESRWGTPYCIDAMLEHAVMHPIRHAHQLRELMASGPSAAAR